MRALFFIVLLGLLLLCSEFSFPYHLGSVNALDLDKILGQKYYLTHKTVLGSYLRLNATFPSSPNPYASSQVMAKGLNDLPYSWISAEIPKNFTLDLEYCFKFELYSNCTTAASWGIFLASFWRYRNGTETKLHTCAPSTSIIQAGAMKPVTWFEWINETLHVQEGDRLILKLKVWAFAAGRFWLGLDCQSFPSYVLDPSTEILFPNADGTNYVNEWDAGAGGTVPPHYDKLDEIPVEDDDTTYISTGEEYPAYKNNTFLFPDSSLASDTDVDSITVYMTARRDPNPTWPSNPICRVSVYNSTGASLEYDSGPFTLTETAYVNKSNTWSSNPWTSRAWTVAEINSIETCNKGTSQRILKLGVYWYSFVRDTRTWLVIEYTPAGGVTTTFTLTQDAAAQHQFLYNRWLRFTFTQDAYALHQLIFKRWLNFGFSQAAEVISQFSANRWLGFILGQSTEATGQFNAFRHLNQILSQGTVVYSLIETNLGKIVIVEINHGVTVIQQFITNLEEIEDLALWAVAAFILALFAILLIVAIKRRSS